MATLRNRIAQLGVLLALALVAAACGGDSGTTDPTEGPETSTESDGSGATETASGATSESTSEAPASESASESPSDGGSESGAIEIPEGSTMAAIRDEGVLTVGTKFDQPLFGLNDPIAGEVVGFDVEIAKLVAEAIFGAEAVQGENVMFVEAVSANREPFIQDGSVDMVVATYTINDRRKEVIDFAGPYYVAGQDIMVATGNPTGITGVDDLNGKRVCSVTGSTSLMNIMAMAPEADLSIVFETYSQCAEALADGRVDAVSTDNVILLGLIDASDGAYELVGSPFTEEPYGIGLAKDDQEFRDFVNDVLEQSYENGDWAAAFEATVGAVAEETPEPPPVDRY